MAVASSRLVAGPAVRSEFVTGRQSILVTGGAGFVGSHFVLAAHAAGHAIVVLDDLSAGPAPHFPVSVKFVHGDIGDRALVSELLRVHAITAVAHFASKIQVAESVADPALYFQTNLVKTLSLLDQVRNVRPPTFLFSSSAAVYGAPQVNGPIDESAPLSPITAYGMSKLAVEHALRTYGSAYGIRWAALRYFNAAGANPDASLRENHEPETHLLPLAIDAAHGRRPPLTICGTDYPTPDGTCIRDYVHVSDIADAHLLAIDALESGIEVGAVNLGHGTGYSVREVIECCGRVLGTPVPTLEGPRRQGDPPRLVASAERAQQLLGWSARRSDLKTIVEDASRSRR
jgi:UDP-glucose-4-epimerase GalE